MTRNNSKWNQKAHWVALNPEAFKCGKENLNKKNPASKDDTFIYKLDGIWWYPPYPLYIYINSLVKLLLYICRQDVVHPPFLKNLYTNFDAVVLFLVHITSVLLIRKNFIRILENSCAVYWSTFMTVKIFYLNWCLYFYTHPAKISVALVF